MTFLKHHLQLKWLFSAIIQSLLCLHAQGSPFYDITQYGAKGDNTTLNTHAIQAAIDTCASSGGGTVYFPAGKFISGTLFLKDNITLYLDAGAVLLGSTNLADFPNSYPDFRSYTDNYTDKSLIYAEKVQNIAIIGQGVIDGQGAAFSGPYKQRPYIIRMIECKQVTLRDICIQNSPMWVQHYLACEDLNFDGIRVLSHVNKNNDGIDIDCCNRVTIANCNISSGDDALVLKSTANTICRNVTISNCILSSHCNAFKLGTESNGGFQNINFSNCTIYDTRLAAIALETVDGGILDRVNVSNVTMENVGTAIFIRLGHRARTYLEDMPKPDVGVVQNIIISDIQATGVGNTGCSITGLPYHPVENITLNNIRLKFKGGGTAELTDRKIEEYPEKYPEFRMFGELPAYAFYCRHAKNLKFQQVAVRYDSTEERPALVAEDVQHLELFDFDAQLSDLPQAAIYLENVNGVFIQGCKPVQKMNAWVYLKDVISENITISNNDFSNISEIITYGAKARKE